MNYSIGDVEDLTGVKAHILRYWEDVIPYFNPQKELTGRRIYSRRDVDTISRLKYLITEKKYTAEDAGKQILEEAPLIQDNSSIIQQIREIRSILSELYLKLKKR